MSVTTLPAAFQMAEIIHALGELSGRRVAVDPDRSVAAIHTALANGFGFGGQNACAVFREIS